MERFLTLPAVFRQEQVWQMPIRQPNSGLSPASSACSRSAAPLFSTRTPEPAKSIEPSADAAAGARLGGTKLSVWSLRVEARSAPRLADGVQQGGRAAGEGLGLRVAWLGDRELGEAEVSVGLPDAGGAGVGAHQPQVGMGGGEALELHRGRSRARDRARSEGR